MLKKFTALFLISAFTQVYAVTPIQQTKAIADELNRSFDELNYTLNVEWDQKDPMVFDQAVKNFEKDITDLQDQGLKTQDLMNHALEKIKDKQIQNDMNELSKIVNENQMSPDEARAFIVTKLNNTYSHGASWSGNRMGLHTAIIVGAIIVILIVCNHRHHHNDPTPVPTTPENPCKKPCYDHIDYMQSSVNGCYEHVSGFQGGNYCQPALI